MSMVTRFSEAFRHLSVLSLLFGVNGLLGVVRMLSYAALLGPEEFGLFSLAQILVTAGIYLSTVGFAEGLTREIPVLRGQGRQPQADQAMSLGLGWSLAFSGLVGAGFLAILFGVPGFHNYRSIAPAAGVLMATVAFNLISAGLRGRSLNLENGYLTLGKTLGTTSLGIAGAASFGVAGALSGEALAVALGSLAGLRRYLPGIGPRPSRHPEALRVARVGFPFLVSNVILNLSQTIDNWFVQWTYGAAALGQYGFAMAFFSVGLNLASIVAQYVQPRVLTEYGRSNDASAAFRQLHLIALGLLGLFLVGALPFFGLLPVVVTRFFPAYEASLDLFPWVYLGTGLMSAVGVYETYLLAERKGRALVGLYTVVLVLVALGCAVSAHQRAPLVAFAIVFAAGRALCVAGAYELGRESLRVNHPPRNPA